MLNLENKAIKSMEMNEEKAICDGICMNSFLHLLHTA